MQSDTLLLADVFENFRNMCIKVYELDPAHFLSLPGLAWQACLNKKTNVKLELLTDYDMSLMVEEGIRGGICHSIHRHAKANTKYMKNYDKNKELPPPPHPPSYLKNETSQKYDFLHGITLSYILFKNVKKICNCLLNFAYVSIFAVKWTKFAKK